jgi:hypothetical protein
MKNLHRADEVAVYGTLSAQVRAYYRLRIKTD